MFVFSICYGLFVFQHVPLILNGLWSFNVTTVFPNQYSIPLNRHCTMYVLTSKIYGLGFFVQYNWIHGLTIFKIFIHLDVKRNVPKDMDRTSIQEYLDKKGKHLFLLCDYYFWSMQSFKTNDLIKIISFDV